ncbi:uncharacterized protein LOC144637513 [Oculina patagonica]
MDDPTTSVALCFQEFLEYVKKQIKEGYDPDAIVKQKEFIDFNKSIQDGRLKSASTPSHFIMTINMNSPAKGTGIAEKRRKLLSIIMRSFFSAIIFCQELPGCFESEVVAYCGTLGYDHVKTGKESAVMWRKEDFNRSTEGPETKDTWIRELRDKLPDASELLSRVAMVKLTSTTSAETVLAVSFHGSHKAKKDAKKGAFGSLNTFLAEIIKEKEITSYVIGGDFNLNTLELELLKDVVVPNYELSPRQKQAQASSDRYIAYKDNFVLYPYTKIRVSWTRPFHFEDEETATSDLSKEDHVKAQDEMAKGTDTPPETTDMLDHDAIIGVLEFPSFAAHAVRNLSNDFEQVKISSTAQQ